MRKKPCLGVNFERTLAEDLDFWTEFIALAAINDYDVVVATTMEPGPEAKARLRKLLPTGIPVLFCGGSCPRAMAREPLVWIDDPVKEDHGHTLAQSDPRPV